MTKQRVTKFGRPPHLIFSQKSPSLLGMASLSCELFFLTLLMAALDIVGWVGCDMNTDDDCLDMAAVTMS